MFENGIILTKEFPAKEIIHNQNSRRFKDQQNTKQLEFHWKILKRGNPINFEGEFESYMYPKNDIGFELNSKTINELLNSKNIFDFECEFEEFDNLQIFEKTPLSLVMVGRFFFRLFVFKIV